MKRRGFTLIELMVVMAILALLAGIIFPTIGGLKTAGEHAQATGDDRIVNDAANRFYAENLFRQWPEVSLEITDGRIANYPIGDPKPLVPTGVTEDTHTIIKWDAKAQVRTAGVVRTVEFVPGFLDSIPTTYELIRKQGMPGEGMAEYLWLFKKVNVDTPEEGRKVEVYRLKPDGTEYVKVTP